MSNAESQPPISVERRISLLGSMSSFEGLGYAVLREIAGCLGTETHAEGVEIIQENQFGDRLYFIESGVVGVYTDGPTGRLLIGKLGEGDRFGDVDLLTSTRRRRCSVVTFTPVTLLTLAAEPYERLVAIYPHLKGELSCTATEFMLKRLEALMQANNDKLSKIRSGEVGF
jgi:CRP-like cAMP-binding protein